MIRVRWGISTSGAWEKADGKDSNKDNRSGSSSGNTHHQFVTSLVLIISVLLAGHTPVVMTLFLSHFFPPSKLLTNIKSCLKKQTDGVPSIPKWKGLRKKKYFVFIKVMYLDRNNFAKYSQQNKKRNKN